MEQSDGPRSSSQLILVEIRSLHAPFGEIAESTKVNMQDQIGAEIVSQVFAMGRNAAQFSPVEKYRVWKLARG